MHRVDPGLPGCFQDPVDMEIALCRGGRPNAIGLVCLENVEGPSIRLGKDGDGPDPQLAAGPDHPHGDFTAVRYQKTFKHPWNTFE